MLSSSVCGGGGAGGASAPPPPHTHTHFFGNFEELFPFNKI